MDEPSTSAVAVAAYANEVEGGISFMPFFGSVMKWLSISMEGVQYSSRHRFKNRLRMNDTFSKTL
jgi:hypothetical protein